MYNLVKPSTKRGLRAFLWAFLSVADSTVLLSPAMSKGAPLKVTWTEGMCVVFSNIRESLCHAYIVTIPLPSGKYSLVIDASGLGIGGVLLVQREKECRLAVFYSSQTKGVERRFSATELEVLAGVKTINGGWQRANEKY